MTSSLLIIASSLVLAQTMEASFTQYGIVGIMLAWLMLRVEKRLGSMETIVRDLATSILLDVVSREHAETTVKDQAILMIEKLKQQGKSKSD